VIVHVVCHSLLGRWVWRQ